MKSLRTQLMVSKSQIFAHWRLNLSMLIRTLFTMSIFFFAKLLYWRWYRTCLRRWFSSFYGGTLQVCCVLPILYMTCKGKIEPTAGMVWMHILWPSYFSLDLCVSIDTWTKLVWANSLIRCEHLRNDTAHNSHRAHYLLITRIATKNSTQNKQQIILRTQ